MIRIERGPDLETAFKTMELGFSDYMISLGLTMERFEQGILKRDANELEHSFIAYDGDEAVAVWLSGIKIIDGVKTMRCGGAAVIPTHRKLGIGKLLYEAQHKYAQELGIQRLMLEVIQGNTPAITLYENVGYKIVREIGYFSIKGQATDEHVLEEISAEAFDEVYRDFTALAIWQQDRHVMDVLGAKFYRHELGVVAVHQAMVLAVATEPSNVAELATIVTKTLPAETFHFQCADVPVWEYLKKHGWNQSELKQFQMEQPV